MRYGSSTSRQEPILKPPRSAVVISDQPPLLTSIVCDVAENKVLLAENHNPTTAYLHIQDHLFLLEK